MNEMTTINGGPATVSADEGDVPSSVLGVGYEPEVLEREEEDEELAAAEEALGGAPEEAPAGELPGELAPVLAEGEGEPVPGYSADDGDVPGNAIGVSYDPQDLVQAEDLEELSEAETADTLLPGETATTAATNTAQLVASQPPTGISGWFKREPLVAALLVANAPVLATLVTSLTQGNETLSILAGSAALVLNAVVGAARSAVTPTADPKLTAVTPLVPRGTV